MIFQNEYERDLYDRARLNMLAQAHSPPGVLAFATGATSGTAEGVPDWAQRTGQTRAFETGATRDTDEGKLDYEGFLSPLVLKRYAEHMHAARKMADGTMRESDNWQKGIPVEVYMKSMWRHFFDVWDNHRNPRPSQHEVEAELCALLFNASGMLHEILKAKRNA